MYKIYALVNKLTGEPFYIGCTKRTLSIRLSNHLTTKNACSSKTVIQEIGRENIEIRLLEEIEDKERAIKCEEQWTEYYRKRAKICNIKTGRKGLPCIWKGKHLSKEIRLKLSKSHKGQIAWNRKEVLCIETGKVYLSTYEAERKTGVHQTNISHVCLGKRKTAGGYHWEYVNQED